MSQYVDEGEETQSVPTFDINDPESLAQLQEIVPDIDPDDIPKQTRPAPPPDGVHWVKVRLRGDKSEPVYYKNLRVDPDTGKLTCDSVIAILTVRVVDGQTGAELGFLKDWYASTTTPKVSPGQPPKGAALTAICKMAGKPIRLGASLPEIKAHVERVFAEAGEEGILVLVKTQWLKSVPKAKDENGLVTYVYKDVGGKQVKDYEPEIKGMKKILELAAKQGIPEDMAHLWYDPVTGDERTVQAQVQSIEDPAKYQIS
jgi:hypothetical protein